MRHYFCYSSSLDTPAFDEWKGSHGYELFDLPEGEPAVAMGVVYTFNFPSRYWGGRVVSLVSLSGFDQPAEVHGVLYSLSPEVWPITQHKESVVTGASVERKIKVPAGNRIIDATTFVTHPDKRSSEGPVSLRFYETLASLCQAAGFDKTN